MYAELEYIKSFDHFYPGIDLWMRSKVFEQPEKVYWSARDTGNIAGLVVIDLYQGKLCHLSISDRYRGRRRVAIRDFLYFQAIQEFKAQGTGEIFAHGVPKVIDRFLTIYPNWKSTGDLHSFGRGGESDQLIKLSLSFNGGAR